jgi:ADP-dependent NAD(P)H-hydrate dehydratase / NAD(P)H-hydrate epimerase
MRVLSSAQMRSYEEGLIAAGLSAAVLMERAGAGVAALLAREFSGASGFIICVGKGNNGGDGLVIARFLAEAGFRVTVNLAFAPADLRELPGLQLERCAGVTNLRFSEPGADWFWPRVGEVLIDALLGLGGEGPLREPMRGFVARINKMRQTTFCRTVALDCPSGLQAGSRALEESGRGLDQAVVADVTVTLGYPKDFLLREDLACWVGRIEVVPLEEKGLGEGEAKGLVAGHQMLTAAEMRDLLPRRLATAHKHELGRVCIIGGSTGMSGAPLLAARGALRAGAGLVSVGVRSQVYAAAAMRAPLEAMVFDAGDEAFCEQALSRATVVAIGPGLGLDGAAERLLRWVITRCEVTLLLDADALTLVAQDLTLLRASNNLLAELSPQLGRAPLILTPHPGEMQRLLGQEFSPADRLKVARAFAQEHGVYLVLKGARTVVAFPSGEVFVNSTGNAALATGGSGDTLLGIIAALIGQGLSCEAALKLAVWWHGRAADLLVQGRGVEEGLFAGEVADALPAALANLRAD